ncbi:MAG: hypothetical protein AAB225_23805 [Acidobacteriota bacterium]
MLIGPGEPLRLTASPASAVYDLPFGKGKPAGGGALGYNARRVDGAFDVTRFNTNSREQLAWNIRAFPSRFNNLRQAGTNNFDISILKDTSLTERARVQFRVEFFNALNHPQFDDPNTGPTSTSFGRITAQYNLPRTVQMALTVIW